MQLFADGNSSRRNPLISQVMGTFRSNDFSYLLRPNFSTENSLIVPKSNTFHKNKIWYFPVPTQIQASEIAIYIIRFFMIKNRKYHLNRPENSVRDSQSTQPLKLPVTPHCQATNITARQSRIITESEYPQTHNESQSDAPDFLQATHTYPPSSVRRF